jgi:hypothetical protein
MNRLYTALLVNAVLLAGLLLLNIWSVMHGGDLFFKLIGTSVTMGLFLSFTAIFKMDFANLTSRKLGYAVLTLAFVLECMALMAIWDIWTPDALFWKISVSAGILVGLSFYLLNLKEDLLRETRQKKNDYLD